MKIMWCFCFLFAASCFSNYFSKEIKNELNLFDTVYIQNNNYSLYNLIKDSPAMLKKIKYFIDECGVLLLVFILWTGPLLCLIYWLIFLVWVLVTIIRLIIYAQSSDVGSFSISRSEMELGGSRSLLSFCFIFLPKCSSFIAVYTVLRLKKEKRIKRNWRGFFNSIAILFFVGTSLWSLAIFFDLLEECIKLKTHLKTPNYADKIKSANSFVRSLVIFKWSLSWKTVENLRIFKSDNGFGFNPPKRFINEKSELFINNIPELRKIVSTIGNNKVEHPALIDINSNKKEFCNMMQLTGKPIKNSAFFELKNYRYRNYVMWNLIQHRSMVHEYGIEKEREILRANGINNRYDVLSLKNFVLIKQMELKNVSRIYELPDGKKIIMGGDNKSFMEGLLNDIKKSEMKNEILFYDKQIHLYEDLLTKQNLLSDDEINYMKNFSEMSCLDFHQKKGIWFCPLHKEFLHSWSDVDPEKFQ